MARQRTGWSSPSGRWASRAVVPARPEKEAIGPCLGRQFGTRPNTARHEVAIGPNSVGPHRAGPDRARAVLGPGGPFGILYLHDAGTRPPPPPLETSRAAHAGWLGVDDGDRTSPARRSSSLTQSHAVAIAAATSLARHHHLVKAPFAITGKWKPSRPQSSAGSSYRILPTSYRPVARRLSSTST
jgi:hypothetical protein